MQNAPYSITQTDFSFSFPTGLHLGLKSGEIYLCSLLMLVSANLLVWDPLNKSARVCALSVHNKFQHSRYIIHYKLHQRF